MPLHMGSGAGSATSRPWLSGCEVLKMCGVREFVIRSSH